ncbi:MAG: hypothetical protein Q9157_008358 [Trypethelium eluteriae]
MTTSRDTPNPLRPYYVPPSVGSPIDPSQSNASAYGLPANKRIASTPQNKSFGASARDLLSDIDYGEYLPESSPSTSELVKRLANQARPPPLLRPIGKPARLSIAPPPQPQLPPPLPPTIYMPPPPRPPTASKSATQTPSSTRSRSCGRKNPPSASGKPPTRPSSTRSSSAPSSPGRAACSPRCSPYPTPASSSARQATAASAG